LRESDIERRLCRFAREHGILVLKLAGPGLRGQPDRQFLKNGITCFIEMKAPGKKPRALQMKWLEKLSAEGFHATWCDDVERGEEYLRGVFSL
jgi:Holliday junction resolvase